MNLLKVRKVLEVTLKYQKTDMTICSLKTLQCPKCGWSGNDYDCARLAIEQMRAIKIVDKHDFLLPRFESWDFRYCPKCLYTCLILFNQREYDNLVTSKTHSIDEEVQKYLNRERK